jgi:hypothetical protein
MGVEDPTSPDNAASKATAPVSVISLQLQERLRREHRWCARCQHLEDMEVEDALRTRANHLAQLPVDVAANVTFLEQLVAPRPDGV